MKPNNYQKKAIVRTIECVNKVRDMCINSNEMDKVKTDAKGLLNRYISQRPELKAIDYSALINALFDIADKTNRYRNSKESYTSTYSEYLRKNYPINDRKVFLPKIGWVNYKQHRPLPELQNILKMIVKRNKLDEYYIYFIVFIKEKEGDVLDIHSSVGLDYSSTFFAVDSNGNKYQIEHFYRDAERKKKHLMRELNRKIPGSRNYKKTEKKLFKLENHIANKRRDALHKISEELAESYDYIFTEDLSMKRISQYANLSKATYDNSYYMFLEMIDYKMTARGKKMIKINKFFPSSKICNRCGYIKKDLKLETRVWVCPECGMQHDRDMNAAINIKNEGIRTVSAGRADHS